MTEQRIFGTRSEPAIDAAVDAFCRARLSAAVSEILFRATSVGVVCGVRLDDGRRVVVKAFQPRETEETLAAAQRVQVHLHREGFPCPAPLAAPAVLVNGLAVAEELIDAGEYRDTHEPACRRLMAEALAWHLELTRACGRPAALSQGWSLYGSRELWPREAHTPTVDLSATADGAEWIDAIATKAKARVQTLAATTGQPVVGHHDWSGKHFRFDRNRVAVVYDWDSLALSPEAVVVGNAAMTFTANFDLPGLRLAPSPDEVRAFVDEYDAARATPMARGKREQIAACATLIAAYTARCEHALRPLAGGPDDTNGFMGALRTNGEAYLVP